MAKNIITAKTMKRQEKQTCVQTFGAYKGTKQLTAERHARHLKNKYDPARLTRVLAVFGD